MTTEQNRATHAREIERIRANGDLSDAAKRRMMAEAHDKAMAEHSRLVEEDRKARAQAVASSERQVLGISYPEGARPHEKAIIAMSYRDARDRAERAASSVSPENPEALMDLLDRAEKSGDEQLAQAAFHVATLQGLRKVADAYLEARPKAQRQWESYVAARRGTDSLEGLLGTAVEQTPPPTPSELVGRNVPAASG